MRERKLRNRLEHKPWCHIGTGAACSCGLDEALAEPPDLVVLLRKVKKAEAEYNAIGRAESIWGAMTLELVIGEIEKTVRLTDDGGWEWTEQDSERH